MNHKDLQHTLYLFIYLSIFLLHRPPASSNVWWCVWPQPGGGVFVEVGAQDGLWLSNTWWLEAERGWRGLLIEADPQNYLNLRMAPRNSTTLAACVTASLLTKQVQCTHAMNTCRTHHRFSFLLLLLLLLFLLLHPSPPFLLLIHIFPLHH